jgi:hypothetical protein
MQTITMFKGNVRVRGEDGNKIFIEHVHVRYIGVTVRVHSFTIINFRVNFPWNVGNFRPRLKKGPKAFWVVITIGADFVHVFNSTVTQHAFDGRAEAFKLIS